MNICTCLFKLCYVITVQVGKKCPVCGKEFRFRGVLSLEGNILIASFVHCM